MKKIAVITDAVSSAFFFPVWHRYYGGLFGVENLHVVTYQGLKDSFAGIALGNLWAVNAAYDDTLRAGVIADLIAVLLRSHDVVIRCDVDEFLLPDPRQFADLADFIERNELPYVTAQGVDVIELAEDAPLDLEKPIFGVQRRYGLRSSALNKTCVMTIPLRWAEGFHGANVPPRFAGLYNLHLKFADIKKRIAWDQAMLQGLVPGSKAYRYFSVGIDHLTGVRNFMASRPKGGAETQAAFDARFLATVYHRPDSGIHQGDFFSQDFLISLDDFAPGNRPASTLAPAIKSFESIGHNCEFGFVANALGGAESGLFRWAYVHHIGQVIAGLNTRFQGLFADPDRLVTCFGEMIEDPAFGLAFHSKIETFCGPDGWRIRRDEAFPALYAAEVEKIGHLTAKFLQTLEQGGKIFVYKDNKTVTDGDAQALYEAIGRFGPHRLLIVDLATETLPAGAVLELEDGLYRGYITRYAPYDAVDDIELSSWALLIETMAQVSLGRMPDGMFEGRKLYRPLLQAAHAGAPEAGPVVGALRAYQGVNLKAPPAEGGKILEMPNILPCQAPVLAADVSGQGLQFVMPEQLHIHGSVLVQQNNALLFWPNTLVGEAGGWSCAARLNSGAFFDLYQSPGYGAMFPGPKPRLLSGAGRLTLDLSPLTPDDVQVIDEPVFLATPLRPADRNFWVAALPGRIAQFRQHGAGRRFLCHAAHDWQRAFLRALGVPDVALLAHDPGRTYICRDVMAVEYTAANMTVSAAERANFFEIVATRQVRGAYPRKLFVTRTPSYPALQTALQALGFTAIEPETLAFAVQIGIFAAAEQIVFGGGTVVCNSVFCPPGASVVTIDATPAEAERHAGLLASLGLRHGVLLSGNDEGELDIARAMPVIEAFFNEA